MKLTGAPCSVNNTLTDVCELIVDQPLPPPPGLNQVFKNTIPRGAEGANSSIYFEDPLAGWMSWTNEVLADPITLNLISQAFFFC